MTDKERAVLHKRAAQEGIDADELDVVIEGRLAKIKQEKDWLRPTPPESEKREKVAKCPNCGATIVGGLAACPDCGYAFNNKKANSSIEKLHAQLDEFNIRQEKRFDGSSAVGSIVKGFGRAMGRGPEKAKMDIISNFPVPNTRNDLLEFLTMIKPQAKSTADNRGLNIHNQEDMGYAYWLLYSNCINKAKISFSDDKDFASFFQYYDEQIEKTKGVIGFAKTHPGATYLISLSLFIILMAIVGGQCASSYKAEEAIVIKQAQEQCDSLCALIDELPMPDAKNYKEVQHQLLSVTWKKISDEYNTTINGKNGIISSFLQKKRAYADQIYTVYKELYPEKAEEIAPKEISDPYTYIEN